MRAILSIIWAVLAALLCYRAYAYKAPEIQQDILTRSSEVVKTLNANAEILVDGRNVTVRGPEPDQASKDKTLAAASGVWGALGPADGLWVPVVAKAVEFFTAEKKLDGSLLLAGSVPTEDAKAAAETAAKASFTGAIDNQLVVSGGSEPTALSGLDAALKSLSTLDFGSLIATKDRFRLSGAASDQATADAAAALETNTPNLWQVFVKGPAAIPASAPGRLNVFKSPNGSITASGEVPSENARTLLLDAFKAGDPGRAIIDRLTIRNEGLDASWGDRALAGAKAVTGLDWGNLSLEGARSFLTGMAPQDAISGITSALGSGFNATIAPRPDDPDAARIADLEGRAKELSDQLGAADAKASDAAGQITGLTGDLDAANKRIAELMAQLAAKPEAPATPAPATPTPAPAALPPAEEAIKLCNDAVGGILREAKIEFAVAKAEITNNGYALINRLVEAATPCLTNPALRVTVGGHTDSQGTDENNLKLSQARAQAVKDVLVERGVKADDITAIGFGESMPIADNNTDAGRQDNRRITIEWTLR